MAADPADLTDVEAIKAELVITSDTSDERIQGTLTAASYVIIEQLEREFAPAVDGATRRFRVEGLVVDLAPWDLRTATTITLHPEESSPRVLTTEDYELDPIGAKHGVYTALNLSRDLTLTSTHQRRFGYALLDIEGDWGFEAVPGPVARACIETVQSWLQADPSGWADIAPSDPRDVIPPAPGTHAIPLAALRMLNPFRRYVSIG